MPGPYGVVDGWRVLAESGPGGMNPSPTGCREREIVGRPDLRPPRACMGAGMVSGHLCRGRRPRRPAEGSRPLPTMQNSNGRRRKVAGRACPAPTEWWNGWRVLAGRGGRHICRPYGVNRQVSYDRKRPGRDESLPYGLCELEIVGRPDLRPPRACAGVGMVSGHLCRGRRPRRPAEGS